MAFKPGEFLLGVIDFFVLLLPGALFLLLLALAWDGAAIAAFAGEPSAGQWLLVAMSAYLAGHLVSGIGARVEDAVSKSRWSKARRACEHDEHAAERELVREILLRAGLDPHGSKNLRRWAAVLVRHAGGWGGSNLERRDADRRFSRNATAAFAVALILKLAFLAAGRGSDDAIDDVAVAVAMAAGLLLAALRFLDQDKKFSRDAYEALIAMDRLGFLVLRPPKGQG